MANNNELKGWFRSRIEKVIFAKEDVLRKSIDETKIRNLAIKKFCEKYDGKDLAKMQEEYGVLQAKLNDLNTAMGKESTRVLAKFNPLRYLATSLYGFHNIATEATIAMRSDAVEELYPGYQKKMDATRDMLEEVDTAIVFAGGNVKLIDTMTKLMEKYGGDIEELKKILPKVE